MTGNTAKKLVQRASTSSQDSSNSIKIISGRQSKELVVSFCGAIGAGIRAIKHVAKQEFEELGYETVDIRVSELMKRFPEHKSISEANSGSPSFNRYKKLQDLGDIVRENYSLQILAEAAITEIGVIKENVLKDTGSQEAVDKRKVVYFIDQLKNPAEVELFRLIYQSNFYLIGVIRSEEERKKNLREESMELAEVDTLIHRDRKSAEKFGQQTEKTILDSDIFIRNSHGHLTHLKSSLNRFISLIHGINGITPTKHERGMFSAFSASLQSACLSRQVGAAIVDDNGNTIAVGRNDVPKALGGLYNSEDGDKDYRCINKGGKCYNDSYKFKIKDKIESLLKNQLVPNSSKIAEKIYNESGISSLLEFSRSIHAEMDAITSISRQGNASTKGTTLYTTTYPCHNCARHIVAAGIVKTIYIEPYEKSLALDLHDDAITNLSDQNKVMFEPFEGISPRRYVKFFFPSADRKDDDGKAVKVTTKYKNHVDIQLLDSYSKYEQKISTDFNKKLSPAND
ncbi:deaminase [Shewanella benthica]|nr:deaminase [Shewanella benthica]